MNKKNKEQVIEVLYQKMGTKWFAFSLVGDEVFVGSIEQDQLDPEELDTMRANAIDPTLGSDGPEGEISS